MLTVMMTAALLGSPQIEWQESWSAAREASTEAGKVLFVSLVHEGEQRSDDFLKLLKDKDVAAAASATINLSSTASRGTMPAVARALELEGLQGAVALPHHLWLDAQGNVLLSVPWEMTKSELLWCFNHVYLRESSAQAPALPADARAPHRLLFGDVHKPNGKLGRGRTPKEFDELIKKRNSGIGGLIATSIREMLFTDEKDAIKYVKKSMKTGSTFLDVGTDTGWIKRIGERSPLSYAPLVTPYAKEKEREKRLHAAVALEQLGDPKTFKSVKSALSKEKDPSVRRAWLRALGATGHKDSKAFGLLEDAIQEEKVESVRVSAILALGYLPSGAPEIRAKLSSLLNVGSDNERIAAACAMAMTYDPHYLTALEGAVTEEESDFNTDLGAALAVLKGTNRKNLEPIVQRIAEDELDRPRIFFGITSAGDVARDFDGWPPR
jgi:HEAT repeat protein